MKILTEATGGRVLSATRQEDLPRIVRTIGLALRYKYVLTYKPDHQPILKNARESMSGASAGHKVLVQLHPKTKFKGYSTPYYKRSYYSID